MHNTVATANCRMPLNAVHEVWGSYTLLRLHKTKGLEARTLVGTPLGKTLVVALMDTHIMHTWR